MELGLTSDEFWNSTPAELNALATAHHKRVARDDRRTAALMALHANLARDPKKRREPYTADDFLSGGDDKPAEPEKDTGGLPDPRMSPENQKIYMSLFFASQRFAEGPRKEGKN